MHAPGPHGCRPDQHDLEPVAWPGDGGGRKGTRDATDCVARRCHAAHGCGCVGSALRRGSPAGQPGTLVEGDRVRSERPRGQDAVRQGSSMQTASHQSGAASPPNFETLRAPARCLCAGAFSQDTFHGRYARSHARGATREEPHAWSDTRGELRARSRSPRRDSRRFVDSGERPASRRRLPEARRRGCRLRPRIGGAASCWRAT